MNSSNQKERIYQNNKSENFEDNISHQNHQNYDRQIDESEGKDLAIEALTTCINSSITKNKIKEMKIQELENNIMHLQQQNINSTYFSNCIPLDYSSPNKVNSSNYSQQFLNTHSSNMKKSPCRKHSKSQSKSPDHKQSLNRQYLNKSPLKNNNEFQSFKTSYWSQSSDFIKDQENILYQNGNNYSQEQFNHNQQYQSNRQNYIFPTNNSVLGIRNDQMFIQSPTKHKSQIPSSNMDSVNNYNNIIQMEQLSKIKCLEEAIDFKNKDIERLMVLTAVSRRNNPISTAINKSPERRQSDFDKSEQNNLTNDEVIRSNNLQIQKIISDLERKNTNLENELFYCKCKIEDKDKEILKIRQQFENLSNCTDNQINFIQINEDLELKLKEKVQSELIIQAQYEQQKLNLNNMEIESIKKLEDFKDIICKIQNQNALDLQNMQQEKDDMQQYINNLQDAIATLNHQNSQNENEQIKRALKLNNHKNEEDEVFNPEKQIISEEQEQVITSLIEKINQQQQFMNQQTLDIDTLKQDIINIQEENQNRISSLIQQRFDFAQGETDLSKQLPLQIARQELLISSNNLQAEKQNFFLDTTQQKEDLIRQKEQLNMGYNRLNDERESFSNEKVTFQIARNIFEKERDQLDQERIQINQENNLLQRELKQLKKEHSQLQNDMLLFEKNHQQFEIDLQQFQRDRLLFQRDCQQLESDHQLFERDRIQFEQDFKQLQRNNQQFDKERQQLEKDCLVFDRDKKEFEKYKNEFDRDKQKVKIGQSETLNQKNQDNIDFQQIIQEKEELISYLKQQQQDNKQIHEKLKQQIQVQIKSYEDITDQNHQKYEELINVNQQLMTENQQLIKEKDQFLKQRNEDKREYSEIRELKKQQMHEEIVKQEQQQRMNEILKQVEVNENLMKENSELKNTLEQLKQKIEGMQNIDDDIKEFINTMCKEKSSLQDRHAINLEEIKNLQLQLKAVSFENKSLNQSLTNLKEEIKLYQNQQTDIITDEKNKKSFLRVHLQKKLNLLNAQLETYIRSTLDLDEIYYIIIYNQQNISPFTSPKKQSILQQYSSNQSGSSNSKYSSNQKSPKLNISNHSSKNINVQQNTGQKIEINEKTKQKIEQLNNKRKRDLDKVYIMMEDFISLVNQIQS